MYVDDKHHGLILCIQTITDKPTHTNKDLVDSQIRLLQFKLWKWDDVIIFLILFYPA